MQHTCYVLQASVQRLCSNLGGTLLIFLCQHHKHWYTPLTVGLIPPHLSSRATSIVWIQPKDLCCKPKLLRPLSALAAALMVRKCQVKGTRVVPPKFKTDGLSAKPRERSLQGCSAHLPMLLLNSEVRTPGTPNTANGCDTKHR